MQMKKLLIVALSLSLCAALSFGQTTAVKPAGKSNQAPASALSAKDAERAAQVDALMAEWSKGETPGAAVLVVQDGRVLLKKGYGLANVETKEPIRPDTVFDLASVSKQFTAMAVLMLAERGKLSLDDPLSKFFPAFPAYAQKITVRHILNHTSGLPDYMVIMTATGKIDKNWKAGGFEPTSADTVKLLAEQKELRFAPGEKWEYSNSGYVVLGQIVVKASGKSLAQFLKENIFQPLGMNNTLVSDETRPKIKNRAISYGPDGGKFVNADYTPLNLIYGDGNVNTTIEDMYLWDQALYTEKLVKAATLKQAFTPGKLASGKETGYGFGWAVGKYGGLEMIGHAGGWAGFRTDIKRFPQERFTVVVLSNLGNFRPTKISEKIAAIYLGDKLTFPAAVKVDAAILQKYVGKYELAPQFILTITLENDALHAQATGQGKNKLAAKSEVDFYLEAAAEISLTFNKNEKGEVTGLTLHQNGDHPAKKIE
jgi:CubicO group peptidase (beta-lactamase class C family)